MSLLPDRHSACHQDLEIAFPLSVGDGVFQEFIATAGEILGSYSAPVVFWRFWSWLYRRVENGALRLGVMHESIEGVFARARHHLADAVIN